MGRTLGGTREKHWWEQWGKWGRGRRRRGGGGGNWAPMGSFEISNGELRNLTSLRSACESCIVAEESIPKSASRAWATEMSSASRAAAAARSSDRERLGGHTMSKSLTRSIAGAADAFGVRK